MIIKLFLYHDLWTDTLTEQERYNDRKKVKQLMKKQTNTNYDKNWCPKFLNKDNHLGVEIYRICKVG